MEYRSHTDPTSLSNPEQLDVTAGQCGEAWEGLGGVAEMTPASRAAMGRVGLGKLPWELQR